MAHYRNQASRSPAGASEFSKLAVKAAIVLGVGLGGVGAYHGIQAMRASSWESDAQSAAKLVQGAGKIRDREMAILEARSRSSGEALDALKPREEAMEFLVGQPVPGLVSRRQSLISSIKSRVEGAAAMEVAVAQLVADRSAGKLDNSAFIGQAKKALAGFGSQKEAGRFDGPAGFASSSLAALEVQARDSAKLADDKLARLKERLPQMASALLADGGMRELDSRAKEAEREAREIAQNEASQQIEAYRSQVKDSARRAFDSEGESMGSDDWREINADLERDPGWIAAKAGLRSSANDSADEAGRLAREQWDQERRNALAMAEMVSSDPFAIDSLSVWEMAMLAQWSASSPGTAYHEALPVAAAASVAAVKASRVESRVAQRGGLVASAASDFARRGYSLSAEPRVGLDGASALKAARGEAVKPAAPRYKPSATTATVASAVAAREGDAQMAQRLAARAAASRAAMFKTDASVDAKYAQSRASAAPGSASPYKMDKDKEKFAWTAGAAIAATKAAQVAGESSAGRAAGERSAYNAAQAVTAKASSSWGAQAASQAAQAKAVNAAVERAAARAAATSAAKSAEAASAKAAQVAASKAAEASAQKAARNAAGKAVDKAADKAADAAANKAAQAAAGKAASKAASTAASKAASPAASKAASAAASKAASAAASKAASAAASRAASSASSRAASSSSTRR